MAAAELVEWLQANRHQVPESLHQAIEALARAEQSAGNAAVRGLSHPERMRLARLLMNGANDNGLPYFRGYVEHVAGVVEATEQVLLANRWPSG